MQASMTYSKPPNMDWLIDSHKLQKRAYWHHVAISNMLVRRLRPASVRRDADTWTGDWLRGFEVLGPRVDYIITSSTRFADYNLSLLQTSVSLTSQPCDSGEPKHVTAQDYGNIVSSGRS